MKSQRLSHEVGWGYKDVVDRLEEKRKIKAQAFHQRKVGSLLIKPLVRHELKSASQLAAIKLRQKAVTDTASSFPQLSQLGY